MPDSESTGASEAANTPRDAGERSPLSRALRGSIIEIVAGLIMVTGGTVVAAAVDGAGADILGAVFVATGSLLASYRAASVYGVEEAKRSLQVSLGFFSEQLNTTTAQLMDTVGEARAGAMDADTCYALMLQSGQTLTELVAQMRVAFSIPSTKGLRAGVREETLELVTELRDTATQMKQRADSEGQPEVAEEFARLESQASLVEGQLTTVEKRNVTERVDCPECSSEVQVELNEAGGASALPDCPNGHRFHVHRRGNGAVFTRPWGYIARSGAGEGRRALSVTCPECENAVPLTATGETGIEERWCLACKTKLAIDVGLGEVVETGTLRAVEGQLMAKDLLRCPTCEEDRKPFVHRDDTAYSECASCGRLVWASVLVD